jgi:hypothetical protein
MLLSSALIDATSKDFHSGITQSARPEQDHTVQDHRCRLRASSQSTGTSTEHLIGETFPIVRRQNPELDIKSMRQAANAAHMSLGGVYHYFHPSVTLCCSG